MKKDHPPHQANVHVFAFRKAPELPVQLSVSPEFLDLSHLQGHKITVKWTLITKGFTFPKNGTGIVFTSPGSDDALCRAKPGDGNTPDRVIEIEVDSHTGLAYAYTVSVVDEATGLTSVLDPGVQVPAQ